MYAAPLKACEWNNTQVVDNTKHKHVTLSVFFKLLKPNALISDCISKAGTCLCAFYFVVSME